MDIRTNASPTTNRRRELWIQDAVQYTVNKVCEKQKTQTIDKEKAALEGYMMEITKMILEKQRDRREKTRK